MFFKFIDQIQQCDEMGIVGVKHLSGKELIFRDHFPANPMLPAAMMVEAASSLIRYWSWIFFSFENTALPMEFDRFRFQRSAFPGEVLKISCELIEGTSAFHVSGSVENQPVFQGDIKYKVFQFTKFFRFEDAFNELLELGLTVKNAQKRATI